jgi:hypothetical protein
MDLDSGSTIRPEGFLRNLEKSLMGMDPIGARHIEFFTRTTNALDGSK